MIVITTTQTRPTLDVPFYIDTAPLVKSSFHALCSTTSHFASPPTFSLSNDGLVHTSVAQYNDQASCDAFLTEMQSTLPGFFDDRNAYSVANGIVITRTQEVV
jgi:hypothetical protein